MTEFLVTNIMYIHMYRMQISFFAYVCILHSFVILDLGNWKWQVETGKIKIFLLEFLLAMPAIATTYNYTYTRNHARRLRKCLNLKLWSLLEINNDINENWKIGA